MLTIEVDYFDLGQICDSGQCFRMKNLGGGRFSIIAGDKYLEIEQSGKVLTFYCSEEEFLLFWISYLDLDADYEAYISKVNPRDRYLNEAVRAGYGIRILRQDLWEMIITFLISQQNNIRRIRGCIEKLCEKYGEECVLADGRKYYAFPEPEALSLASEEDLRDCNLGYRARYVRAAAQDVVSGRISLEKIRMARPWRARKMLLSFMGIGEKVADCICLFALHDLNAFPIDTHIRQVMDEHYKRGFPNRRYRGFRGVIQQYIFYYELIKPKEGS